MVIKIYNFINHNQTKCQTRFSTRELKMVASLLWSKTLQPKTFPFKWRCRRNHKTLTMTCSEMQRSLLRRLQPK